MNVVVSGGGTGGHFFPALALIECLLEKGHKVEFVGSERGIEYRLMDLIPCSKRFLKAHPFVGRNYTEKLKALFYISVEGFRLNLRDAEKSIVFGGYASLPLGLASLIKRRELYLHEQNSIPSLTNNLLSKFSKKVFITFEYSKRFFPKDKVVKTGLPVRKRLLKRVERAKEVLELDTKEITLLVVGGSQGATFLNELAVKVFEKTGLQGIHITGERDRERVESFYREKGLRVRVFSFREDMELIYSASDVAISRAGASTITELSLFGIPTLFIPYPFSARDHQYYNAKEIEELKGGFVLRQEEADIDKVINLLERIMRDREEFSNSIKSFANLNACEDIIRHLTSG